MKRSDISTLTVLEAYEFRDFPIDEALQRNTGAPPKVVWAAMQRECDAGYLEYGTSLRGGWLTDLGRQKLDELRDAKGQP